MTTQTEALKLALEMVQNKMYAHAEMYLKEALAQPEQEPVAHTAIFHCPNCEYPHRQVTHITGVAQPPWSPQRKPLTDEEIGAILEGVNAYGTRLYTFARAIEAKLKEKNT